MFVVIVAPTTTHLAPPPFIDFYQASIITNFKNNYIVILFRFNFAKPIPAKTINLSNTSNFIASTIGTPQASHL
jgi:hypothetical protein